MCRFISKTISGLQILVTNKSIINFRCCKGPDSWPNFAPMLTKNCQNFHKPNYALNLEIFKIPLINGLIRRRLFKYAATNVVNYVVERFRTCKQYTSMERHTGASHRSDLTKERLTLANSARHYAILRRSIPDGFIRHRRVITRWRTQSSRYM